MNRAFWVAAAILVSQFVYDGANDLLTGERQPENVLMVVARFISAGVDGWGDTLNNGMLACCPAFLLRQVVDDAFPLALAVAVVAPLGVYFYLWGFAWPAIGLAVAFSCGYLVTQDLEYRPA